MNLQRLVSLPIKIIVIFLMMISCATFARADQIISYSEVGQGEPLVLIHAFPTDQRLWTPQQQMLKQFFRVITIDLSGFGKAEATDGSAVTMAAYARQVRQLLDQLHIEKAIIGGESMGGYISLAFLKRYPERVLGLVLSNTQAIADADPGKRETVAKDVIENGPANLIRDFMPKALSAEASDQTRRFLQMIVEGQTRTGIASALRGIALREDTSSVLRNTTLPVLIMTVKQDAVISPQQSEQMHALAKNSKLVVIDHAGHLSSLEQPAQWNQAVVNMFYRSKN